MKNTLLSINGVRQKKMHCGPACIEMVLKFYGVTNIEQEEIGKELNVKIKKGCFSRDVIRYLKKFNIEAEKTKFLHLIEKIELGRPIFLGAKNHFMLLIGYEDGKYIYIDPETGRKNKDTLETLEQELVDLIIIKKVGNINGR